MRRVVADTTVLISAFLTPRGVSSEFLRRAREGAFHIVLAPEILDETHDRLLRRRRLRRGYGYTDHRVYRFHRLLQTTTILVTDLPPVSGIVRDPNDDMVIACALKARADYIVTRDKDLLSLGAYESVRIVTPRQLLDLLEGSGAG
jgi:putative PIN family toxin of toxin-antitoxin system